MSPDSIWAVFLDISCCRTKYNGIWLLWGPGGLDRHYDWFQNVSICISLQQSDRIGSAMKMLEGYVQLFWDATGPDFVCGWQCLTMQETGGRDLGFWGYSLYGLANILFRPQSNKIFLGCFWELCCTEKVSSRISIGVEDSFSGWVGKNNISEKYLTNRMRRVFHINITQFYLTCY